MGLVGHRRDVRHREINAFYKEQVRRNIERFPGDFMFELTKNEFEILRSQFATSSWGGSRYAPMAFTEHE
jgi:hypothetical protein